MDFRTTPEDDAFRQQVRIFIEQYGHKAPSPADLNLRTPERRHWQQLLLAHGYIARTVPSDYGGHGAAPDPMKQRILSEEFSRAGITDRMLVANRQGVSMLVPTLLAQGTPEQRARWIAPTLRGEIIWCQGYSEPGAGSDLAGLRTSARQEGDYFVISGQKIWTSEAQQADMMFCLVRTEPDAPKHQGISFILVPMASEGVEVRPLKTMTGRSSFNEVFLTDVRVPIGNVVGGRGNGWRVANEALKHERGALGNPEVAEARFQALLDLMQKSDGSGRSAMDNPVLVDRLVGLQAWLVAMRSHSSRILTHRMKDEELGLAQLIVKLQGCELNHELCALAIDVQEELGTLYGESAHGPHEWQKNHMFDLGLIIGGGTAQIQKNIIAERGLGMPRDGHGAARK